VSPPEVVELGLTVSAHLIWFESAGSNSPPRSEAAQAVTASCASVCSLGSTKGSVLVRIFVDVGCGFLQVLIAGIALESPDQMTR
jgi:hypothetical protein